jgi:hypothetical protein
VNDGTVFIPSELCVLGGIPDEIRTNGMAMRNIMATTRRNPAQKMKSIEDFAAQLCSQKTFKEWGVEVDSRPQVLDAKVLPAPTALLDKGYQPIDENFLRQLAV